MQRIGNGEWCCFIGKVQSGVLVFDLVDLDDVPNQRSWSVIHWLVNVF